jgi:hypothetical protein
MRMIVVMLVIMWVIVRIRYFGLLLGSLICVCHLSRGQVLAFQETSVSAAPHVMHYERGYATYLLYEASVERVKPRAFPSLSPATGSTIKNKHSSLHQCSRKVPESVELNENISSRIFHCIDCPGCSTTIPVSSSFAH